MELWTGHNGAKSPRPVKQAKRRQKRVTKKDRTHTIVDPLQRGTIKETSAGDLVPDPKTGYYTVESDTLASEVKARYPWMIVTEHARMQGDPEHASVFASGFGKGRKTDAEMEADGWKKDGTRWVKVVK